MKRARTLILDTLNSTGITALPVPLTPALSLGEREKPSAFPNHAMQVGFSNHRFGRKGCESVHTDHWMFPLTEGEGLFSVAAGVSPALEPGILPGGLSCGSCRQVRVQRSHSRRQDAARYGRKPALNTYEGEGKQSFHTLPGATSV